MLTFAVCGTMARMRRAGRIMLNGITILSLLLALVVAAAWGRSYARYDFLGYYFRQDPSAIQVHSSRGRMEFCVRSWLKSWYEEGGIQTGWRHSSEAHVYLPAREHAIMGISWTNPRNERAFKGWKKGVIVPHAYLLLLFAAFPVIRVYRAFRRRRLRLPGHCRRCNYDLRATPGRCPECGAIPTDLKT
jgi:hypothetical protein